MPTIATEYARPLAELKTKTAAVLRQARQSGRPVILTVNGQADSVLMDAKTFKKCLQAASLGRLLAVAEADVAARRIRPFRSFLREFKRTRQVRG